MKNSEIFGDRPRACTEAVTCFFQWFYMISGGGGKKVKKSQKNVENTRKGPQTTENHVFCRLFGPVRIPQTLPESTVNEREKKRKQVSPPVEK